jgi:hypothetical protein
MPTKQGNTRLASHLEVLQTTFLLLKHWRLYFTPSVSVMTGHLPHFGLVSSTKSESLRAFWGQHSEIPVYANWKHFTCVVKNSQPYL